MEREREEGKAGSDAVEAAFCGRRGIRVGSEAAYGRKWGRDGRSWNPKYIYAGTLLLNRS
jgi:hypothetical protein